MSIQFKCVRWKNILSTGNVFTEVKLDKSPNTLIVGSNGAGKSTILDALCFGLYGKSFRKVKKDQLINTINNRDAVVEIEFDSYGKSFKIIRGLKPNIFEIYQNDELLNQPAAVKDYQEILERTILRMNMKSFAQIVVLGSASFVPFMQLSTAIRREVIEDLLDIRVFSTMSTLLKARIVELRETYLINNKNIESTQSLISMQELNRDRETRDSNRVIEECKELQSTINNRIATIQQQVSDIDQEIDTLTETISDSDTIRTKLSDIDKIESSLEKRLRGTKKVIAFYQDNDTCPTCIQPIGNSFRDNQILEKNTVMVTLNEAMLTLSTQLNAVTDRLNEITSIQNRISIKQRNISALNAQIKTDQREVAILSDRIDEVSKKEITEVVVMIDDLKQKLDGLNAIHESTIRARGVHDIGSVILRDTGIKSRIIKQYIPVINALVNKYLAAMDFFVKFELNEAFEEKILSRHRDDFTYESFSEGEKMRIDLALLFTWRAVARMKNSANTNLLILDEVFDASLDTNGCDEFLKLIHSLDNTNVFVISHKGDILQDKFRASIRFEKHHNFSRIA